MTSTLETTGAAEGEFFKTDTVGRVRVPRVRREALLDEFELERGQRRPQGQQLGAYGPWVRDLGHHGRPEIHPCEVLWWMGELQQPFVASSDV